MDGRTQARFEARARILKALAHPSRLFMVEELSRGERCVCDLTGMVGADMSTVSKHLSVLKAAGIVAVEKRGMQVWYRLKTPCVLRFFDCIGDVIQHSAREQAELVRPVDGGRIRIQILGAGCGKCKELAGNAEAAARELGLAYELEKVTDAKRIRRYGVLATPSLAVDGKVRLVGKVATAAEIRPLLRQALLEEHRH